MENSTNAAPIAPTFNYAGFGIRLIAFLIDAAIISAIAYAIFGDKVVTTTGSSFSVQFNGVYSLIPLAYQLGFWILLSATPGKMICGLKIIGEAGKKLTPVEAILRIVGYVISGAVILVGFIWIAIDSKHQGWHDKIAKTFVIKK